MKCNEGWISRIEVFVSRFQAWMQVHKPWTGALEWWQWDVGRANHDDMMSPALEALGPDAGVALALSG
jgi:hypothetical protein